MKILFLIHGYKPAFRLGGPIISVSELAEQLVKKGHQVTVVTTNSNLDEDIDVPLNQVVDVNGVSVLYFKRTEFLSDIFPFISYLSKASGFVYASAMKAYMKEIIDSFDLVHTHLPFIYPTYLASKLAKNFNVPLFYHQRGVLDPKRLNFRSLKKKAYIKLVELPILRQAATLIALTQAEVESYKRLCSDCPCRVVPNGIDTLLYRTKPLQAVFDIPPETQVILFMGRVHPIKGADKLIEAFIKCHNEIPNAILVMAGPDEFYLEDKFMQRVKENYLTDKVIFPGMTSGELKKDLLARANLFCLPSDAEGFSMAILEALASSTPVMISPGCNFPEVESSHAGVVIDNELDKIAESLVKLLSNPEKLQSMGNNGYYLVQQNYTWDRISDEIIDVYKEGIERYRLTH